MKIIKINKKIINFITGNIKTRYMLFCIFLFNLLFFFIYNGNAIIFSDFSREIYIPAAMNNGFVLYKDIFNVYAPLGYQINAFLLLVFGENLRTFYYVGFINSTLILFGLFFILKLFIKRSSFLIFSILFFIMMTCFYAVSQTNYITPYSYSMVYALNTFIWSLAALLHFVRDNKKIFLYLTFLFFGASISFKYEFIPFIFILLLMLVYKRICLKTSLFCIVLMFIIPFISIADLFTKGVTANDLQMALHYMIMLSKTKSVAALYSYLGFIPTISSLKVLFTYFIKSILFVLVFSLLFIAAKKIKHSAKIKISLYIIVTAFILYFIYRLIGLFIVSNAFYFNWIGVFSLILFIILCSNLIKKYKGNSIDINDKLFFILFASTIICSFKCLFNISFNSYGTYYFPLIFICCFLYAAFYIFTKTTFSKRRKTEFITLLLSGSIIFIISGIYEISNLERYKAIYAFQNIITPKGKLLPGVEQVNAVYETVNYIKNNTNEDDTILVLPEGAIINFLTNRKSHNKYYYLIPPNIEIFSEDKIVNDLEKNLPDYLVIQPMSYNNFKETYFCESFGTKICALIPKYYKSPIVFGNPDFWLAVYKIKSK